MSVAGIVTRNWRLKVASFALALLLWGTMRLTDDQISRLEIPAVQVRVDQSDPGWLLRGAPSPAAVEMTVSGPMGDLLRAAMSEPVIVIPIDSVSESDLLFELADDWVRNLDRGSVTIEDFAPSSVRLLLERYRVDEIPVSMRLTGRLPDSLALLAEPRANLLFAQVRGPESEVDVLETVFLRSFDLGAVTGPGRFEVEVDTARLGGLMVTPTVATIIVEAAPREERVIGPLPVRFPAGALQGVESPEGDDPQGWLAEGERLALEPDSLAVTLSGAAALLDEVDPAALQLRIAVDLDALRRALEEGDEGVARAAVELSGLPPFVTGAAASDSVTVRRADAP